MPNPITITDAELEQNYKHWLKQWATLADPDDNLKKLVASLFPTHTFGFIKTIEGVTTYPYMKIFGIGVPPQGLLSDAYREENKLYGKKEVKRTMTAARAVGLDHYVFAYLSIHDPYYGRPAKDEPDMNSRPFGIFISRDIEKRPGCLPSRRDVNIYSDTEIAKTRKELLHPDATKLLAAYQVQNDSYHKTDFWHYYGSPDYCLKSSYSDEAWKKRIEYHYLSQVEPTDIAAVLWPKWQRNAKMPGVYEYDPSYYAISEINGKFPDLKIITYDWDEADPEMCFLEASYHTTKYIAKNNSFPDTAEIAKNA